MVAGEDGGHVGYKWCVQLSPTLSAEDRARIEARYPRSRVPRWLVVALVGLFAAGSIGWLLWAATLHSLPEVSGAVNSFTVQSDRSTRAVLTVQRRDPSVPVRCRVIVQATNFETVGEVTKLVPATPGKLVDVTLDITTLRRGTSASSTGCSVA